MTTTLTPPAATWQSRDGYAPMLLASVYTRAATLISQHGYTAFPEYEGETGHSLDSAIDAAARAIRPADSAALAEEARTRLAGLMYLTGHLTRRTSVDDITDQPAAWERHLLSGPRPDGGTVLAVLGTAAAMLAAFPSGDDQ